MKEEITIQTIRDSHELQVNYSDEDIVIIDNVRNFTEPSMAYMSMNIIAICTAGKAAFSMNGQSITIGKNQIVLCPPNVTVSDFMISPDFEFKAMFLTNRMLQSFLHEKMNIWNEVMYVRRMHVLDMSGMDIAFYSHFMDMLRLCFDAKADNPYRTEIIRSLLRSAFLGLIGLLKMAMPESGLTQGRPVSNLFQRFLDLLHATEVKHRPVEYYADQLCISAKYLSAICKNNSGKTANEWITEHVLEDIRYYLKSTNFSVKQICGILGFPNTSFFGKYVKTHFGLTPMQFRQK